MPLNTAERWPSSAFASTPGLAGRSCEVMAALLLLGLLAPLLLFVAVVIKLESPGPVLFRQKRCGGPAGDFDILKFRTMRADAERSLAALIAADGALRSEYERCHKLSRDPRVTRFGRFLRATSIDELPQLWNVVAGDMSFVGPRPYLPGELDGFPRERRAIQRVRPGITGLWQVSGRHRTSFSERVRIDALYARNKSLTLDTAVILKTAIVLMRADGV